MIVVHLQKTRKKPLPQNTVRRVTRGMRPAPSRSVAVVPPLPDVGGALAGPWWWQQGFTA